MKYKEYNFIMHNVHAPRRHYTLLEMLAFNLAKTSFKSIVTFFEDLK